MVPPEVRDVGEHLQVRVDVPLPLEVVGPPQGDRPRVEYRTEGIFTPDPGGHGVAGRRGLHDPRLRVDMGDQPIHNLQVPGSEYEVLLREQGPVTGIVVEHPTSTSA